MAWTDTLLDATFRGVTFDCVNASDAVQRALVEHDYPYVAGADVEDMGAHARHISLRAVFYGADYETRMQAFIAALAKRYVPLTSFLYPIAVLNRFRCSST